MNPSNRRYQERRRKRILDEAITPMKQGLLSEGSTSLVHFAPTLMRKMRARITNNGKAKTDYEKRAFYWHMTHIGNLTDEAIESTETFKEARLKLWWMIDNLVLEHQETAELKKEIK